MDKKVFVNFSNHKSGLWNEKQKESALKYGEEIVDLDFPVVDPDLNSDEVSQLGDTYINKILSLPVAAVMCQGESTLSFYVVNRLIEKGIVCLAACSRRVVKERVIDGVSIRESQFEFERFREYRRAAPG